MELLIGIAVGLLIGWFCLPAPQFVVDFWKKIFGSNDPVPPVDPPVTS